MLNQCFVLFCLVLKLDACSRLEKQKHDQYHVKVFVSVTTRYPLGVLIAHCSSLIWLVVTTLSRTDCAEPHVHPSHIMFQPMPTTCAAMVSLWWRASLGCLNWGMRSTPLRTFIQVKITNGCIILSNRCHHHRQVCYQPYGPRGA